MSSRPAAPPPEPTATSPRRPIRKLPLALVNRIAAGEVIERPASVVKELVENAIDAGATHIDVEVDEGGLGVIRVVDDGCGIPPEELPLALAEHATSKLVDDEDLFRIDTKGFRGEALASIASVSHLRLTSRTPGSDAAWSVESRGGEVSPPPTCAGNIGANIKVRNLFFNTPARRKFMKGPGTEYGHVAEMLLRLALPHPDIGFTLSHNGRVTQRWPPTTLEERLLEAWPADFRDRRLPIDAADAEIRIAGILGLPELAHPSGRHQYLYVNRRPIRDRFIAHALKESFRGLTEPGRHPAAVLLISLPPQDVDVNVHPTKVEVRFRNSSRVHGLVMTAVREVLLGADLTPHAAARAGTPPPDGPATRGPGTGPTPPAARPSDTAPRPDLRETLAAFFRAQPTGPSLLDTWSPPSPAGAGPTPDPPTTSPLGAASAADPEAVTATTAAGDTAAGDTAAGDAAAERHDRSPEPSTTAATGTLHRPAASADVAAATANAGPGDAPPAASGGFVPVRVLQLHNTYLVRETPEGLEIIDQHALHERVLYEELLARVQHGPLEGQRLLIPAVLRVSPHQLERLESLRPLMERLGVELMVAGPGQVAVTAFPHVLTRLDPAAFVRDVLERAEAESFELHPEALLGGVLEMMACKAAVKAGDPLTPQQIDALLAKRHLIDRSSNCPHGRPTALKLTLRDLERQFKRTGF
ncbi:MAG: DNA mismatch repair endonuclease MutL [Tepidisphaerales bacterium]